MTVNECEAQVLSLLDEVGATEYARRMNGLINMAQRDMACECAFIRKKMVLDVAEGESVALPGDCYVVEAVRGGTYKEEPLEDGGKGIVLSGSSDGRYTLFYKAYPDTIGDNEGAKALQIPPEYHSALCARVAALTQANEYDKRAYQIFMEMYKERVATVEYAKTTARKVRVVVNG